MAKLGKPKKDTPPRTRTPVRIVNLKRTDADRWDELPANYASSADAIKAQSKLGAGTYQVAHLFGKPRKLKTFQPPLQLVEDDGEIGTPLLDCAEPALPEEAPE